MTGPTPQNNGFNLMNFLKNHTWDAIAYVVIFIGLILMIIEPFIGQLVVGLVGGVYFAQEIMQRITQIKERIIVEGVFRSFMAIALLLALLLAAPGLIIGALAGSFLRTCVMSG